MIGKNNTNKTDKTKRTQELQNALEFIKKIIAYALFYFNFAITFLFTLGGAAFSIPPICQFLALGQGATNVIGGLCTLSAFWGSYVVYKEGLKDLVFRFVGVNQSSNLNQQDTQVYNPSRTLYSMITVSLVFSAIFYVAGGYFAMLQFLPPLGLQNNVLAKTACLGLGIINYIPNLALTAPSLIKAVIGEKSTKKDVAVQVDSDLVNNDEIVPGVVNSRTAIAANTTSYSQVATTNGTTLPLPQLVGESWKFAEQQTNRQKLS